MLAWVTDTRTRQDESMELDLRTTAPPLQSFARRLPIGAEVQPGGGVHFRVWAPDWKRVDVVLESVGEDNQADCPLLVPMIAEGDGYFSAFAAGAATARGTDTGSMASPLFPIRPRVGSRRAPMGLRRSSIPATTTGTMRRGGRVAAAAGHL